MQPNQYSHRKVTIIGTGLVGMSYAYAMTIKGLVREIGLINRTAARAEGEAMDLSHGLPFVKPMDIQAGGYELCRDAQIVVIAAGANQKEGETRLDLAKRNVKIVEDIVPKILEHNSNPILLIVSNPVDILTHVALKVSGLPSQRVISSGTVLDTMRFRHLLSEFYDVDPRNVHGYVIGEHGDSEVPVWSRVNIAGIPLDDYCESCGKSIEARKIAIENDVRTAAYDVIEKKQATYYAIGLAMIRITEAVLMNQHSVLTVGTLMQGEYGLKDVCLSLPSIVGAQGVDRVLANPLADSELHALRESARILREGLDSIGY
ncbi:L-lactate dehydrogenase [Desulfonatronum thiosulfatophilum]|uniref:L-lactate dehydrogenase n=1 Tax=Desulfonatronum thiosulfatophilum TaxID=617002 RepID=A0A1G6CKY0_9BACT|nr:L-lactate dehydrogenase [Desulfonatronum thiosulfatophilum]SDB33530.1 L-lactate dehydrogenase [Desulfonatronum thiosulfatophilum]